MGHLERFHGEAKVKAEPVSLPGVQGRGGLFQAKGLNQHRAPENKLFNMTRM